MSVTLRTIASDRRSFCSSDLPGQSFTMTCGICLRSRFSSEILLVRDMLHPSHRRAVQRLLDRDVRHRRRVCGAMPVFVVRGTPDDIACPEFDPLIPFALRPAGAGYHDQRLTERVRVPGGPRARLEAY